MSALSLVVFDMDGTLIDSQKMIVAAMQSGFETRGHALPEPAKILSIVGLSLVEAVAQIAPDMEYEEQKATAEAYKAAFIALRKAGGAETKSPLYPGARDALERLGARDEVLMGVATGKAMRGVEHAIETHALHGLFHTLQTADGHPSKPHPSMLHTALAETGVERERAVMIGDTSFDISMGRSAGFRTIGVSWGYHPVSELREAGADVILDDYADLDAVLAEMGL